MIKTFPVTSLIYPTCYDACFLINVALDKLRSRVLDYISFNSSLGFICDYLGLEFLALLVATKLQLLL